MRSSNCAQQHALQAKPQGSKHQKKITYSNKSPSFVQNTAVTHQSAVTLQVSDSRPLQQQTKPAKGVGSTNKQVLSQNGSLDRKQPKPQKSSNSKRAIKENSAAEVVLDLQRKKSQEFYPQYSKSTKVSPSIQAQQQFLGQKISKNQIIESISGHLQETSLKQSNQFKIDAQNIQNCQQYTLRIPLTEQDRNQYTNYTNGMSDIEQISPNIISQTQSVMNKFQPLQNKEAHIISGGNSVYEHQEMTFENYSALGENNGGHQKSFINLIYPSMSKKIMSGNFNKFNSDVSVDQVSSQKSSQVNLKQNSDFKNVNNLLSKKTSELLSECGLPGNLLRGKSSEDEIYQSMPNFNIRNQNYNMSTNSLIEENKQKMTHIQNQIQNIHSLQASSRERINQVNEQSQSKGSQGNEKNLNQCSHHQKSKSLFSISEHLAKSQAQLSIPTQASVQKVNKSSYKKQSTVFNYSQRLKELLNDSNELSTHQMKKHQLFSQQPSPTNSSQNIFLNFNDIQLKNTIDQQFGGAKGVKNTFDKQLNHYITLGDQAALEHSNISHTIDTYLQTKQPTPVIKYKQNESQVASKIHLRKPSHPVMKNNFVIEQNQLISSAKHQSFIGGDQRGDYARDSIDARPQQPQREKKQHQPTQSKKPCHQRSSSDYLNSKNQQSQPNLQQQKLKKFLNSAVGTQEEDSFEIVNDNNMQFQPQCFSQGVTPKGQIANKNSTSFLQQYSQALIEAQIQIGQQYGPTVSNQQLMKGHDHSFAQEQQNQHIANTIQGVSDIKNIYHQRKLSHQPQSQTLQAKKSPLKNTAVPQQQQQQFVFKEHYQKLAKKNKISPKANLNHQYQMNANSSRPTHNKTSSIGGVPQTNQNNFPTKYSQINSPLCGQNVSQMYQQPMGLHNITQQQTQVQTSINQFLNKYQQQQFGQSQHSASAAIIAGVHQKQQQPDMKSQIIQQATKKYQDQLVQKQMQQQKQTTQHQANRISLKKPIQSEKVSPRQPSKGKQNVVNVSIDLAKGLITTTNQSNPGSVSTTTCSGQNRQSSTNQLLRQSVPTQATESQSVHNSIIVRKNSFVQQQQQQQQVNTFRIQSPNSTLTKNSNNKSSATLNPPEHNQSKGSNQIKYPNLAHQRYSVQNSPQKASSLFQKSQKNTMYLKNQSQVNINYQQINQSQISQKPGVVSPHSHVSHNRSSSFTNFKANATNNKSSYVDRSDSNYSLDNENSLVAHGAQMNQKALQIQGTIRYDELVKLQKKSQVESNTQQKKQVMSETEQLLNQIRSNILHQKYGQQYVPQQTSNESVSISFEDKKVPPQKTGQHRKNQLCKITEASVEQHAVETVMDVPNYSTLRDQISSKKPKLLNISTQLHDEHFLYQTTDPGLSPYSKDLLKLKKMISFNFKKFNDPPVTSSEFYRIGRVLGRGAFGKVNLAAHKLSEQLAAIKSINKEFLKSEEDQRKKIMQEFSILKQSNHKNVVRLYDTFETSKHICFVMELCSGGDLLTYVRKRRKLKEDVAKYFFKQIIEGLAYIHNSKLIVHRDIKLDNILLDANGKIKICDFGVSKQVMSETEKMTEQCGTPAYIAPEILRDKGYEGFKVDVWSAGVCLFAMLVGTVPFKAASMHELHHLIINGKYEIKEEKMSESAQNLIKQLLEVDWKKRLSACEVLNHPWLKDAEDEIDVFTQKEKDTIQKEYLSKNIDRALHKASSVQNPTHCQDTEGILTEHGLDTKTNQNSLLKNASTKSIILAPFNSTVSDFDEGSKEQFKWPTEVRQMIVPKRVLKFNPKVKDIDRQYEQNNNADLDNGVYNNFANEEEEENKNSQSMSRSSSSLDSLKKSFKETELSSDDEKAEQQVAESRENKLKQQTELQEFENQLKMKYVRYLEPVEIINTVIVDQIVKSGVYPRDYLINVLNTKEMNYATANYHLLNKKQQFMQKFLNQENQ